ncbi:MAG: FAD-dependent oxidoreductase [Leptolyngbya sp. SIO1E4]|nr:FAD-dependent oxidoreductase [Leptolyngbya sp. SIO1E4]
MKVAIVGAGISGLLTAYRLKKKKPDVSITLFEKRDRVGGNIHTVKFAVGQPGNQVQHRWADLGVNDFNIVTYKNIAALLDELEVAYKPIEDSAAYSTLDGAIAYVIDPGYQAGSRHATTMPTAVQKGFDNFSKQAPIDCQDPTFAEFSIADYIQYRNAHNPDNDPEFYPTEFVRYNLYPRINGMYFVHDTTPSTMSFVAIMGYYSLQEGFGSAPPERAYVEGGCQTWVNALCDRILAQGVTLVHNAEVQVFGNSNGVDLLVNHNRFEHFDAVVMACHASTSLKLIKQGITDDIASVLSQFDHYNSVAVAHTYAPLLPPDRNIWRTYNILIHGDDLQLRPYTISYVCNRHQNDAAYPDHDGFGNPQFFVTLNPAVPIPESYVLKRADGTPAVTHFTHNVVNVATLKAQKFLWTGHGTGIQGQNNLYFTGGWTMGTGLHEECYQSAASVVDRLLDQSLRKHRLKLNLAKAHRPKTLASFLY